jgi:hypothetical protein
MARGAVIRPTLAFAAIGLAAAASGCSVKPPEIAAIEWRLESRPSESGSPYESLSVFADIKDEEGLDNLVELWVVEDESALSWKMTDADWIKAVEGGDTWFGASALSMADFSPMPRGTYRFIAIDAGGQRVEREFQVAGDFPDRQPPTLAFAKDSLSLHSEWPETLLLAFDSAGALIAMPGAQAGATSLAGALGEDSASRTAEIGAYGYDPNLRMGSFSKRAKTR